MAIRTAPQYVKDGIEWWLSESQTDASNKITQAVTQINSWQLWRRTACQRFAQAYAGHGDGDGVLSSSEICGTSITLPRNIVRQGVNTVLPKTVKHRPMPQILTDRGDWSQYKRSKKMTEFVNGEFDQQKIFNQRWGVLHRDAMVFGDGLLKTEDIEDYIKVERVLPWEWFIDSFDGRYGDPKCAYHVRTMDLGKALFRYGKVLKQFDDRGEEDTEEKAASRRAFLRDAATSTPDPNWDSEGQFTSAMKRVRIVDAWHLCDDERAHAGLEIKDHECTGRHMSCILTNECVLFDEIYEWDVFPINPLQFSDPLVGSRGVGLVRQMESWQDRITNQADKVDDAHRISGGVVIFCSSNSGVVKEQFSNEAPMIKVDYDGAQAPIVQALPTCDPSVYQREQDMPMQALSEQGISMQSAGGLKHPGINSGVAIETIDDIEDERWTLFGRNAEDWCCNQAKMFIRCATRIAKRYGEYSLQVKMRDDSLLKLSWSQVSLNDFQVRVFPSSILPQQPSNRLQKLQTLFDGGIIDRQTFLQQLGAPDLNGEIDVLTAMRINIDEKLEAIVMADTDAELRLAKAMAIPNSYVDYKWMQLRAQLRLMQAETKGCSQENLSALRDICDACQVLIDGQTPPMPAAAGAMPPPPGAALNPGMPPGAPPSMGAPPMAGGPPMPPNMPTGNA